MKTIERKPFTMYRWCGFHNLPMSICDNTSSMSCWYNFVEKSSFVHEFLWNDSKNEYDESEDRLKLMDRHLKECKVNMVIIDNDTKFVKL